METEDGIRLICRTYSLLKRDSDDVRPSPQYKDVILKGAAQNNLPKEYIEKLIDIETNGYTGEVQIKSSLDRLK